MPCSKAKEMARIHTFLLISNVVDSPIPAARRRSPTHISTTGASRLSTTFSPPPGEPTATEPPPQPFECYQQSGRSGHGSVPKTRSASSSPKTVRNEALGLMLGLGLEMAIAVLKERLDDRRRRSGG